MQTSVIVPGPSTTGKGSGWTGPSSSGFDVNGVFDMNALLASGAASKVLNQNATGTYTWTDPGRTLTSQESLGWAAYLASQSKPSKLDYALSDNDKAYIRQVTGANIVTFLGGMSHCVDDNGNLVSEAQGNMAQTLASSISADRQSGELKGELTQGVANEIFEGMRSTGVSIPRQMAANSDAWFQTLMGLDASENARVPSSLFRNGALTANANAKGAHAEAEEPVDVTEFGRGPTPVYMYPSAMTAYRVASQVALAADTVVID